MRDLALERAADKASGMNISQPRLAQELYSDDSRYLRASLQKSASVRSYEQHNTAIQHPSIVFLSEVRKPSRRNEEDDSELVLEMTVHPNCHAHRFLRTSEASPGQYPFLDPMSDVLPSSPLSSLPWRLAPISLGRREAFAGSCIPAKVSDDAVELVPSE